MNSEEIKHIETCSICYCNLDKDNKIKLKCNHIYCYDCIYNWFKKTLNPLLNTKSTINIRECPYCRTLCFILPCKEGYKLIYNVNTLYIFSKTTKCLAETKNNNFCTNIAKYDYSQIFDIFKSCGIHKLNKTSTIKKYIVVMH